VPGMGTDPSGPRHWPALQPEDTRAAWARLRAWVEQLAERFPLSARAVPPCWYRHNHLVETLQALRDFERACCHPQASPSSALEFLRAVRETEAVLIEWVARTGCTASEHHESGPRTATVDDETRWQDSVEADHARRAAIAAEVDAVLDYQ